MKCPECGAPMQNGFIPAGGGISWFDRLSADQVIGFAKSLPGTSAWFRRARLEAYRCTRCRLVTFRYGRQVDDPKSFEHK
ncbi:MAG: hypothetical protein CMJ18_18870 [Phycisphaeraceae bacterium]|nr:hypothetical protein [Phycisphaeraceae bacterium]